MEVTRPAKGTYETSYNGGYLYYETDDQIYEAMTRNGLVFYGSYNRVGEQISARPVFYATQLWALIDAYSAYTNPVNWNLYVQPKIQQKIKTEYPLMDSNSVARLSFWPAAQNKNDYASWGDTSVLPYGIYYARKNWIETEWATSNPNDMSNWVSYPYAGVGSNYIANITSFSGEYYPRYLLGNGAISVSTQVAVRAGQNILVNSQTNASENGVYRVTAGAWIKMSQIEYPSIVYVFGYGLTYVPSPTGSYDNSYIYVRGGGSTMYFYQSSDSNFSSNFTGTGYPRGLGFYLYHTLDDALNNTNKITYTAQQSFEYVITDPTALFIDENYVQHYNTHTNYSLSPIDYTYPSFKFLRGIGCYDQSDVDIVTSDIPDNMSFTFMGHSVSLKRFSSNDLGEIVPLAEATAYYATHYRAYDWPPLRYSYFTEPDGMASRKYDSNVATTSGFVNYNIFQSSIYYQTIYYALNRVGNIYASMFGGQVGIDLKTPSNTITAVNHGTYYTYKQSETRTGTYPYEPWVYHDYAGRRAFFWAVDLNMILVAIYYTNISYYLNGSNTPETVFSDGDIVISSSDVTTAIFFNDTPNSSNRTATFSRLADWSFNADPGGLQQTFLDTLPTSITVNRGGEFTLPNQLRLNMPNCFFANQYVDIDTASLVKGTTKLVQDPISVGDVNVVLTLDKTDGAYYSEMMTLGVIKGRFRILTNMYNLNTGNWLKDHSIQTVAVGIPGAIGGGAAPTSGIISQWNLGGYRNQFNTNYSGFWNNNTDSFKILGSVYLAESFIGNYLHKDFINRNIAPQWYVANDALGGYTTGLGQGTVWMDTRVSGNEKRFAGEHLNATPNNSAWCAVMFSEWQELRSPATVPDMHSNTIGPTVINNVYNASISGSTVYASSYTLGAPSWIPATDFYKRNHYYVQSSDSNCWLSSLSV